jgi:hypothetical protein
MLALDHDYESTDEEDFFAGAATKPAQLTKRFLHC